MKNIIKFTVSLDDVKIEKRRHAVRHIINWVDSLGTGKYREYERFPVFRSIYFDSKGNSLVEPFLAYAVMEPNRATVYIEADKPTNIYNLVLFYWRTLNHRKISPYKPCFVAPTKFSFKVSKGC